MQYATLPNTDIRVSRVAMGCWGLSGDATWGHQDEGEAVAAVRTALDEGINFFDTAELYGNGLSEERVGKALSGRRGTAVIASKFSQQHASPEDVARACEASLRRLRTDYLDLYQIHWRNRHVPLEATWSALQKLKHQGKVRALGVSNFGVGDLADLLACGQPASNQLPYSLLNRAIEWEILPRCREEGIGVLGYSPLQLGLLSGKFHAARAVPDGRARTRHFSGRRPQARHGEPGCEQETFQAIQEIRHLAQQLGRPMTELAVAWLLNQPGVTSVLVGIRRPDQARQNAALDPTLTTELRDRLAEITQPVKRAFGPNPDAWESQVHSRFR